MLVVIPARGGSKGVPGKNIKILGGKPLIYHTIDEARKVFSDDKILVSTDDEKIKEAVESIGLEVPFLRPTHLATDKSDTSSVLIHALDCMSKKNIEPKIIVLLQPTSPFRTAKHIQSALANYDSSYDMLASVTETSRNPYYVLWEENEDGFLERSKKGTFSRRQDCPTVWELNGAIYVINVNSLRKKPLHEFEKIKKFPMDPLYSHDIDTQLDWLVAEQIFNMINNSNGGN